MNIIRHVDPEKLYDDSALTLEGLAEESFQDFIDWVKTYTGLTAEDLYVLSGKEMDDYCHLTGTNRYPDDVNIVSIMLKDMEDPLKIVIPRFEIGGRWFDDIVDNNARREEDE